MSSRETLEEAGARLATVAPTVRGCRYPALSGDALDAPGPGAYLEGGPDTGSGYDLSWRTGATHKRKPFLVHPDPSPRLMPARGARPTATDRPTDRPAGGSRCEPYPIRATLPAHSLTPSLPAGTPPAARGDIFRSEDSGQPPWYPPGRTGRHLPVSPLPHVVWIGTNWFHARRSGSRDSADETAEQPPYDKDNPPCSIFAPGRGRCAQKSGARRAGRGGVNLSTDARDPPG